CTSSFATGTLATGAHTFSVKQFDALHPVSAAATVSWTIGTPPPAQPTITGGPATTSTTGNATFTFSGNGTQTGFLCSLDGATYSACTSGSSGASFTGLTRGSHTFCVEASNAGGASTPAC